MKKFLLKISLFLLLFSGLYLLLFYAVHQGLLNSRYRDIAEWNEIREGELNADLLIIGSSRAWRQVDPTIVDKELHTNSYNLGIDGYHIPMQLTKYEFYRLYNQPPAEIIYIVDHFSFDKRDDLFNKEQFLPYVQDDLLMSRLKEYDGFNWEHFNVPFYQYSGTREYWIAGMLEFLGTKSFQGDKYKGFRSKSDQWDGTFDAEKKQNPNGKSARVLQDVVHEFDSFLSKMEQEKIKVNVVYAPEFEEFQDYINNRDSIMHVYTDLCNSRGATFIDYSDHYLCKDQKYFYNPTHLNSLGVEIFTKDLTDRLRSPNENGEQ